MTAAADVRRVPAEPGPLGRVPAEPGLWLFILLELSTFSVFFAVIAYYRIRERATFAAGQADLNSHLALVSTLVLITGSLAAARAVREMRRGHVGRTRWLLAGSIASGLFFVGFKVVEYHRLVDDGHTLNSNHFFLCYFGFTLVHLAHVLIGTVVLLVVTIVTPKRRSVPLVEGAAMYWHMVDLVWLILFPLLYLR